MHKGCSLQIGVFPTGYGLKKQDAAQPFALIHALQVVAGDAIKEVPGAKHSKVGQLLTKLQTHANMSFSPSIGTDIQGQRLPCGTCVLIHSLAHSSYHSCTHSPALVLIRSLTQSLTHSLTH